MSFQQLKIPGAHGEYAAISDFITIEEVVSLWDVIGPLRIPAVLGDIIDSNSPPLMMVTERGNRVPAPDERRTWARKFVKKCMDKPRLRYVSPLRIDSRLGWFVNELVKVPEIVSALPQTDAEFDVDWWEADMDASAWWNAESVKPVHAAMLLCRHNPNTTTEEKAARTTTEETTPEDFNRLKHHFEGASEQQRTLEGWADYAKEHGLKVHSWLESWLRCKPTTTPSPRKDGGAGLWWQTEYDIEGLAQDFAENLVAEGHRASQNNVAEKVAWHINARESRKAAIGEAKRSISTTRLKKGPLKGWKYAAK